MKNQNVKQRSGRRAHPVAGLLGSAPFAAVAYFCKFVLPGYSFTAMACLGIICVILFYSFVPMLGKVYPAAEVFLTRLVTTCLIVGFALFAVTEAFIIRASFGDPQDHADYMVVLGAKVRPDGPSVSLWDRIYEAYDYMQAHPDVIAVVSGGQGYDEVISEAQSMFENLVAMGISPDRIWMEDKATSTDENMRFSLDLIQERTGQRPTKLAILSSEYHLFRASLMAKKLGLEFVGVPARTSRLSQLINHGMREVAGVWHFLILGW